jgi:hypothetical protein
MLPGIRGLRLTVIRLEAEFKYDESNPVEHRQHVIGRLEKRDRGLDTDAAAQQRRRLAAIGDCKTHRHRHDRVGRRLWSFGPRPLGTGNRPHPGLPGWGPSHVFALGRAADASLEQQFALGLRQAAPYAIGLADRERVAAALRDHRAAPAHLLGTHLALRAGPASLAVGMKKHSGIDASAKPCDLPIPDVSVGSG